MDRTLQQIIQMIILLVKENEELKEDNARLRAMKEEK